MPDFNLDSYLQHSKKVDVSDMDFSEVRRYSLSPGEIRCLTYMMDIEAHTIVYLKGILSTCAVRDPRTTAFLSCWAYEEFFHGHTLRRFLEAAGVTLSPVRMAEVQKQASWREWVESIGASLICQISRHFHAVYLTWGAISELTTLEGYGLLASRTNHPMLAELLHRLAKDERKHFSFYYNMAREHLQARAAQRLTTAVIKYFWMPVGGGVKPDLEVDWMNRFILGDTRGEQVAARIDATIGKLPGLSWFDRLSRSRRESISKLRRPESPLTAAPTAG
jgi:fatty acid desaturase